MINLFVTFGAIDKLIKSLEEIAPGNERFDANMRLASESVRGLMLTRIHEDGKAADGSQIGTYSTKPMYANPETTPGATFTPEGKTGRRVFESTGANHKTKYFDTGYKGLRNAIGKQSDSVNLNMSGIMQNTFMTMPTQDGYGLGWESDEMLNRARALEVKYGRPIWALTAEESAALTDVLKEKIQNGISG